MAILRNEATGAGTIMILIRNNGIAFINLIHMDTLKVLRGADGFVGHAVPPGGADGVLQAVAFCGGGAEGAGGAGAFGVAAVAAAAVCCGAGAGVADVVVAAEFLPAVAGCGGVFG